MLKPVMAALAVTILATPALAQWQPPRDMSIADPQRQIMNLMMDDAQRAAIQNFYAALPDESKYLPAARRQMSQILMQRGNHVPHGVTKADLPPELEAVLPGLPANVERIVVDNSVLLVDKRRNMILDGMVGVIPVR